MNDDNRKLIAKISGSKGGIAAAESLGPKRRHLRAKKARQAQLEQKALLEKAQHAPLKVP
jgi:hypothetical protein